MKLSKLTAAALGASALALLAGSAKAADTVDFVAAGSSAQFSTFTQAFLNQGYSNHYSEKARPFTSPATPPFYITDAGDPIENAQVAIYWKGSANNYNIAVFYQVDSTVGVRSFFNSDTLVAPTTVAATPAPDNVGLPGTGDVVPPLDVLQAVNGAAVSVGATDITPEDARVATERAINLGYSTSNPIKSAATTYGTDANGNSTNTGLSDSTAIPVRFSITSKPFTLFPLGAVPIVVFVNNGANFASLTGANLNIDSFQLAGFLSGQFTRVSDLNYTGGASMSPVHTYIREPLSGTYNTMEYCNTEALGPLNFTAGKPSGSIQASGGQELKVSSTTKNPLNETTGGAGGRVRAIGTGELIAAVDNESGDALGYAFYSAGSFKNAVNKANHLRYLTVDGADPLQDSYTGGTFPASVTFRNVANGGYPLWSILRVVTNQNPAPVVTAIITSAQGANVGTDFVQSTNLRVLRSYHTTPYTPSSGVTNGNNGSPAAGGDVGGAVFSINNDFDYINDTGGDLTELRQ